MVYLVVNVFTDGATFSDVQSAYCRMVNADTEQEIGRFQLENLHGNAVVFARIEKHQKGACAAAGLRARRARCRRARRARRRRARRTARQRCAARGAPLAARGVGCGR